MGIYERCVSIEVQRKPEVKPFYRGYASDYAICFTGKMKYSTSSLSLIVITQLLC